MPTHNRTDPFLPAVDERLAAPESGVEVVDGEVVDVSPSDERHGRRQSKLSSLLEAHVAEGWFVAADMLTRTSTRNDQAPDASVYPAARDSETGGRQLEVLAFEILDSHRETCGGGQGAPTHGTGRPARLRGRCTARPCARVVGRHAGVGTAPDRCRHRGSGVRRAIAHRRARVGGPGRRCGGARASSEGQWGARVGAPGTVPSGSGRRSQAGRQPHPASPTEPVLDRHGLTLQPRHLVAIERATDEQLLGWVGRVASARTVDAVFETED